MSAPAQRRADVGGADAGDVDRAPGRRFPRWAWWAVWVALVLGGLALKSRLPVQYIFEAGYDDFLFVQMASGFLHGHWSSSFSVTGVSTLAKPAGYPIFLAAAHVLAWSPVLSAYAVGVAGACLAAFGWLRMSGSRIQATIVLAVLVFDPVLFSEQNQRVYRDGWIAALGTVVLGCAFALGGFVVRPSRLSASRPGRVLPALGRGLPALLTVPLGLAAGWVAITKPTWYWLVPAAIAPIGGPVASHLAAAPHRLATAGRICLAAAVAAVSCAAVIEATVQMNRRAYGVALVEDFSAGGLARAWAAWASVEAGPPVRYDPVTKQMREAVYRVSPTAREMEPYLESPSSRWWVLNCHGRSRCDGAGKYFEWDLRSAAAASGRVHDEVQLQAFFDSLADQIDSACAAGTLTCSSSPVLATGLPPLDHIPLGTVASDTGSGLWRMVLAHYQYATAPVSEPPQSLYATWASVVPGIPPRDRVAAPGDHPRLYQLCAAIDDLFSAGNLLSLALICGGILAPAVAWSRRRRRSRAGGTDAGSTGAATASRQPSVGHPAIVSLVLLVSVLIGVGTLAVFDAGQSPTYLNPMYWSDFSACLELCLVFGAFAGWRALAAVSGQR